MNILWFTNCVLKEGSNITSGSWLVAMSSYLVKQSDIKLTILGFDDSRNEIENINQKSFDQWAIPKKWCSVNKLPDDKHITDILSIVDAVQPDLVHIWGIEEFWGLLLSKGLDKYKCITEIQGLKSSCAEVYWNGLSFKEKFSCYGLRELLFPSYSLFAACSDFRKWERREREILAISKYVSVQSHWTKARVQPYINEKTEILVTLRPIREQFIKSTAWKCPDNNNILAFSAATAPYKGMHILLKALVLVKKRYPDVKLKLAGPFKISNLGIKSSGYMRFLHSMIAKNGLDENIEFVGSKSAIELVELMQSCRCFVQPSFVESYSAAVAEAMAVGIPSVISYAGAMTELAIDGESALFYSPLDHYKCAFQIIRLLESRDLSKNISAKAREIGQSRNDIDRVIKRQMDIYNSVYNNNRGHPTFRVIRQS